jgi:hypothetical protein
MSVKKIILSVSFLVFSAFAFAQSQPALSDYKPKKGSFLAEGIISNIAKGPDFNQSIKFRYFLKDDLVARISIGGSKKTTLTYFYDPTPGSDKVGTSTDIGSLYSVFLGLEKHVAGMNHLSAYVAADLGYGSEGSKQDIENGQLIGNDIVFAENNSFTTDGGKYYSIGVNLGTGADYYIVKKLYLGAELGIQSFFGNFHTPETSTTTGNNTTSVESHKEKKETDIATSFAPSYGFRIGYIF